MPPRPGQARRSLGPVLVSAVCWPSSCWRPQQTPASAQGLIVLIDAGAMRASAGVIGSGAPPVPRRRCTSIEQKRATPGPPTRESEANPPSQWRTWRQPASQPFVTAPHTVPTATNRFCRGSSNPAFDITQREMPCGTCTSCHAMCHRWGGPGVSRHPHRRGCGRAHPL